MTIIWTEKYRPKTFSEIKGQKHVVDKVHIKVDSGKPGLTCSGLSGGGEADGTVTLYGNPKIVTCTQTIDDPRDLVMPVTIELEYDYGQSLSTNVVVKRSG